MPKCQFNVGSIKEPTKVQFNLDGSIKNITKIQANIGGAIKDLWTAGIGGIDAYTKLMLHMNGANGSATFTDSSLSPKTVTANGNAQISTSSPKFGTGCGLLDGTGDYLSVPDSADWYFASGDLTIDFWVNFISTAGTPHFCGMYAAANSRFGFYLNGTALSCAIVHGGNTNVYTMSNSFTFNTGTWYHVAYVRYGNILKYFISGTQQGTDIAITREFPDLATNWLIGQVGDGTGYLNAKIDEFRISKGIARWTTNFTPPAMEYST